MSRFTRLVHAVVSFVFLFGILGTTSTPAFAADPPLAPEFQGVYSTHDLGSVPGLPAPYGGLTFKPGDPNTLLIGGSANAPEGAVYAVPVVRDASNHVTGLGSATLYATAPNIDGGLTVGPGSVLISTAYPDNSLSQFKPGSIVPDKIVDLNDPALGYSGSVGSVAYVPPGQPGAGSLKILVYNVNEWFSAQLIPDGSGTYNVSQAGTPVVLSGGIEGTVYVPLGSPGFLLPSVLVAEYSTGTIVAYEVDPNGDPKPSTRREFVTGLGGALGSALDPVTNDFFFSTFGGGNSIIRVGGFVAPTCPPGTTGAPPNCLTLTPPPGPDPGVTPELDSLVLLGAGLVAIGGLAWVKRRRNR